VLRGYRPLALRIPAIDQNRVVATMREVGERWLVSELSAY
jgi:Mce-associated membrane protein